MEKIKKCFLWGATGQAKVIKEFVEDLGFRLEWLFDNNPEIPKVIDGVNVVGGWSDFIEWQENQDIKNISFLITIGGDKGRERLMLQEKISEFGFNLITAVHKTAYIAKGVSIGDGSQVLANSTICVDATIGRACIVNTGAQIDHECVIGDGVHIMPGAILAGLVEIENFATIGSGAVILPRMKIGKSAIVGAGAVVVKDVEPNTVVVGVPAKFLKRVDE